GQGWLFGRPSAPWPADPGARPPAPRRVPGGRLEGDLERAECAREACEAIVDHLARRGLLPSVFLIQAGRLRCQASRGFCQVFDGLPATAGIVGRVFRSGETAIVDDVGEAPDYLAAIAGVRSEICVPLRVAGQIVGVLDGQSVTLHDRSMAVELERCAAL